MKRMIVAALACVCTASFAGNGRGIMLAPGVSIGYTFGAGVNYGFSVDAGLLKFKADNKEFYAGTSLSYYLVCVKQGTGRFHHRIRTVNLMIAGDYFNMQAGWGRIKNKQGQGHRYVTNGWNVDVSSRADLNYMPWFGVRYQRFDKTGWSWFKVPYISAYAAYRFPCYTGERSSLNTLKSQ